MMIQITGIIVRKMVLLLNYRARGAPSLGPTPRDGPLPNSPGVPRPLHPSATYGRTCDGAEHWTCFALGGRRSSLRGTTLQLA